jgi:hypothetical protein
MRDQIRQRRDAAREVNAARFRQRMEAAARQRAEARLVAPPPPKVAVKRPRNAHHDEVHPPWLPAGVINDGFLPQIHQHQHINPAEMMFVAPPMPPIPPLPPNLNIVPPYGFQQFYLPAGNILNINVGGAVEVQHFAPEPFRQQIRFNPPPLPPMPQPNFQNLPSPGNDAPRAPPPMPTQMVGEELPEPVWAQLAQRRRAR